MSNNINSTYLVELDEAHDTFTSPEEIGGDAATDAPATSPFCVGVLIGATLTTGC